MHSILKWTSSYDKREMKKKKKRLCWVEYVDSCLWFITHGAVLYELAGYECHLPECWGWRSAGCVSSAASGWCCRRFPVCSGAAPPPPDAYEGCESHKASVCGDDTMETHWKTKQLRGYREEGDVSYLYLVPGMSIWACSTRSVVHTSSSPQSLKNGIYRGESRGHSMLNGK